MILVAQGKTGFFRADPSGLVYRVTPDSIGVTTARRIGLQLLRAFQPARDGV